MSITKTAIARPLVTVLIPSSRLAEVRNAQLRGQMIRVKIEEHRELEGFVESINHIRGAVYILLEPSFLLDEN